MATGEKERRDGRVGMMEACRRTWRALRIYGAMCPSWFAAVTLNALLVAGGPYVTVWLSARA